MRRGGFRGRRIMASRPRRLPGTEITGVFRTRALTPMKKAASAKGLPFLWEEDLREMP